MRQYRLITTVILMFSWLTAARAAELQVGDPAPDFALKDQSGVLHRLQDYRGRWVVLYFYPKDDTPGCTKEACAFRDDLFVFGRLEVAVLGMSLDDAASHKAFADKYGLPFPLLADVDGTVAAAYGALFRLGPIRLARRHTFILGPDGRIAALYRDVDPKHHSAQVIAEVKRLRGAEPGG